MSVTAVIELLSTDASVDALIPARVTVTVADETAGEFAIAPAEPLTGPYGAPFVGHYYGPVEPGVYVQDVVVHLDQGVIPGSPEVVVVDLSDHGL
jgi:hypothetical protein